MEKQRRGARELRPDAVTTPALVLCLLLFLVLGFVPILPSTLSQPLRPAFIAVCVLFGARRQYPFSRTSLCMIVFQLYFAMVLVCNTIRADLVSGYFAMALFGLFFVCCDCRRWSGREIVLILNTVALATAVFSAITLYSNPDLLKSSSGKHLMFLGGDLNRNTFGFTAAVGAVCGTLLLLHGKGKSPARHWVYYGLCTVLNFYTVFATGCRSAFFAAAMGMFLLVWEKTRSSRFAANRWVRRLALLCFLALLAEILLTVSDGTYSARLFDFGTDDYSSGRDELWETAWVLIRRNPVFGGGFDYWGLFSGENVGTHNSFLTIMVAGGWVGGILLGLFFLSAALELLTVKSLIPWALMAEALMHTMTEPSMDYYAYIPLALSFMVLRYLQYQDGRFASLFEATEPGEEPSPAPARQSVIYANRRKWKGA